MDEIYLNASRTQIYLGPETPDSEEALAYFTDIGQRGLHQRVFNRNDLQVLHLDRWITEPSDPNFRAALDQLIDRYRDWSKTSPVILLASLLSLIHI